MKENSRIKRILHNLVTPVIWLKDNSQWVFGGIGVAVLVFIFSLISPIYNEQSPPPVVTTENHSVTKPEHNSDIPNNRHNGISILICCEDTTMGVMAKQIASYFRENFDCGVEAVYRVPERRLPGDTIPEIVLTYRDATQRELIDEIGGIIGSRWMEPKRRFDATLTDDYKILLRYSQ